MATFYSDKIASLSGISSNEIHDALGADMCMAMAKYFEETEIEDIEIFPVLKTRAGKCVGVSKTGTFFDIEPYTHEYAKKGCVVSPVVINSAVLAVKGDDGDIKIISVLRWNISGKIQIKYVRPRITTHGEMCKENPYWFYQGSGE